MRVIAATVTNRNHSRLMNWLMALIIDFMDGLSFFVMGVHKLFQFDTPIDIEIVRSRLLILNK
jgi:hypothetical protein